MARMNLKKLLKTFIFFIGVFVVFRYLQHKVMTDKTSYYEQEHHSLQPRSVQKYDTKPVIQNSKVPVGQAIAEGMVASNNEFDDYPRIVSLIESTSRKSCPNLRRPKPQDIRYRNNYWQLLKEGEEEVLVISAFYDDRPHVGLLPIVRMHTVMKASHVDLFCQFWYPGTDSPHVVPITVNTTGRGENIHGIHYGQYMFSCQLPSNLPIPKHLSVSLSECGASSIFIPIYVPVRSAPVHEFGVCVAIAFGEVAPDVIAEWIELNRMFGITEFNIYNGSMTDAMRPVFQYYEKSGILRVHQMPPPTDDFSIKGAKLSSAASLNECMLRNMYRYRFIVVIDFDEFIVPYKHNNYSEMISAINRENSLQSDYYAYTFRNVYYFKDFPPDTTQPETLITLRYRTHAKPNGYMFAPKSFVDPRRCVSVFNHWCYVRFKGTPNKFTIDVKTDIAASHHYRKCGFKKEKCSQMMEKKTKDDFLLKYKNELETKVSRVLEILE